MENVFSVLHSFREGKIQESFNVSKLLKLYFLDWDVKFLVLTILWKSNLQPCNSSIALFNPRRQGVWLSGCNRVN